MMDAPVVHVAVVVNFKMDLKYLSVHLIFVILNSRENKDGTQLTFSYSKSTIQTLEKGVKYVQS